MRNFEFWSSFSSGCLSKLCRLVRSSFTLRSDLKFCQNPLNFGLNRCQICFSSWSNWWWWINVAFSWLSLVGCFNSRSKYLELCNFLNKRGRRESSLLNCLSEIQWNFRTNRLVPLCRICSVSLPGIPLFVKRETKSRANWFLVNIKMKPTLTLQGTTNKWNNSLPTTIYTSFKYFVIPAKFAFMQLCRT